MFLYTYKLYKRLKTSQKVNRVSSSGAPFSEPAIFSELAQNEIYIVQS